jgi:NMD protein affecting ribosome stability and mRNA decay
MSLVNCLFPVLLKGIMLNSLVRFCVICGNKIDNNVSPEILKHRKGMCIKCFLKAKKKSEIEYCQHKDECRYFNEEFCIKGNDNGWYEYTVDSNGSNKCFREKLKINN